MTTSVATNTVAATGKVLFVKDFAGETTTIKDMVEASGLSKVTIMKIVSSAKLSAIGKVASGGRGRPASLFDKAAFLAAIANRGTKVDSTVDNTVKADAVADTVDSDSDADQEVPAELSVEQINALMGM